MQFTLCKRANPASFDSNNLGQKSCSQSKIRCLQNVLVPLLNLCCFKHITTCLCFFSITIVVQIWKLQLLEEFCSLRSSNLPYCHFQSCVGRTGRRKKVTEWYSNNDGVWGGEISQQNHHHIIFRHVVALLFIWQRSTDILYAPDLRCRKFKDSPCSQQNHWISLVTPLSYKAKIFFPHQLNSIETFVKADKDWQKSPVFYSPLSYVFHIIYCNKWGMLFVFV